MTQRPVRYTPSQDVGVIGYELRKPIMREFLFLGGEMDGQRLLLNANGPTYAASGCAGLPPRYVDFPDAAPESGCYSRLQLNGDIHVYLQNRLGYSAAMSLAMALLVAAYTPLAQHVTTVA